MASFGSRVEEVDGMQAMSAIGESGPSKRRKTRRSKGESTLSSSAAGKKRKKKKSVFFGNYNTSRHVGDKAGAFWLSNRELGVGWGEGGGSAERGWGRGAPGQGVGCATRDEERATTSGHPLASLLEGSLM